MVSIAQIHGLIGRGSPAHPHLSVIAATWQAPLRIQIPLLGRRIESALYAISLKRGDECHVEFGRQRCDGQEGTLVFLAPGQALIPLGEASEGEKQGDGWTVVFHPDLLHGTALADELHQFRFFGYAAREALHLTAEEGATFTALARRLDDESSRAPDGYTTAVLIAQLQLLLRYCQRAYARQWDVRARDGQGVAGQLARHLDRWLVDAASQPARGLPTVRSCARALGYSADYLSDLLRAETGQTARAHIQDALIEAAKARLLDRDARSSAVAYALGFEHPQAFTRLFRQKTGCAPSAWVRAQRFREPEPPPEGDSDPEEASGV